MNEDFFQNISSTGNPIEYADTVQRYQTQLPLGISWPTVTGSLNPGDLYTDDTSLYMYYPSGLNRTAIAIQQRDRYGGITFTLVSGSANLYIQASEYFADPNPAFISSPYTVSGEGGTNLISASYSSDTPENPQNYWINLPNPGTYKVVFPNPVISTAFSVTHSGSSPYVFSQMLPRKSIGSYDIDVNSIRAYHVTASFIDAVAIQVSDSIVVGPDLIGAKSIDGSKIIDGTISGVLIQNGTVTGNKILAGTISGSLIQAGTITADNIASNTITASKIAGATITFNEIASNTLTAAQIADGAITGRKILDGTISGVLIQDDAISSSKIQANAITASKIAAGTITANEIAVSGISAANIQAGAITSDKISARVITAEKIVLSGITAELLGAEAVTAAALATGSVISGKIAADSIYGSNIVGGVITGYHVAANTITGDRIQANTISGALITAGTITATNIAVSGITADKLNVTQLDAVAANMGSLVVNSDISIGTGGTIWAGAGTALSPQTGLKIYTTSGISRLTTYSGCISQIDIGSDGKLYAGSGQTIRLDSTGILLKTSAASGEPLYNGGRTGGDLNIITAIPPSQNVLRFHPYKYTPATYPAVTFTEDTTNSSLFFIENTEIYYPVTDDNGYMGSVARLRSGWKTSESSSSDMYKKTTDSVLKIESYADSVASVELTASGPLTTGLKLIGAPALGKPGIYAYGNIQVSGSITTSGNITSRGTLVTAYGISSGSNEFSITSPKLNYLENSGKPTLVITGSGTSGTSGSITLNNLNVATPGQKQGYINMDGNNTLEITNEVTNGNLHLNIPDNGILRVYANSPATPQLQIDNSGLYIGTKASLSDGSVSAPSLTFTNDSDTGFYSSGGNFIRVATNGTQSAIFGPDRLLVSDGTVSSPGLQFITDQNTGMYSVSADNLGFAAGGTQRLLLSSAGAGVTGKITSTEMGYLTVRRTADLAITTAGTTIVWQSVTRSGNISVSSDTITIDNAGYYTFSATFATVANLTSLRMTLLRGGVNYVSTLHGAGLSSGGGYMFNFSVGFFATAGSTYKISLTPSSNTTLNFNGEGFAGPTPILNIYQAIGV